MSEPGSTEPARPSESISASATIGDWLEHETGGPVLLELIARLGADPTMFAPARNVPLQNLVELSRGGVSAEDIDSLVLAANGGVRPEVAAPASSATFVSTGRFDGKRVIVTGAASGIGRATALRIVDEGGVVIAVDLSGDGLVALASAAEGGAGRVVTVTADVTDEDSVGRVIDAVGGTISGLANVAGIADDTSPVHEVTDAVWARVFAVNVDAVMRLTRAVVPSMIGAGGGSIVNVASEAALRGSAAGVAYTASKHAVVGITRSSAFMYAPNGIRVNAVAPGGVATGIPIDNPSAFGTERTGPLLATIPPIATAQQIAASITFLLSDDGININGAVLPSDGGWSVQ